MRPFAQCAIVRLGVIDLVAVEDGPVSGFDLHVVECGHIDAFGARAFGIDQRVSGKTQVIELPLIMRLRDDIARDIVVAAPEFNDRQQFQRLRIGRVLRQQCAAGNGNAIGVTGLRDLAQLFVQK